MTLSFLSRCSSEHAVGIRTWDVRCEPWSRVLRGTDELKGVPMLYGLSVGIHLVHVDARDPRILRIVVEQIQEIHASKPIVAHGADLMDADPRLGTFLSVLPRHL